MTWLKMLKSSVLPALALGAVLAVTSPASAQMRGGGHSGFAGGGHAPVAHGFVGGREFGHGPVVVDRGREFYRGGYWGGPAVGFGFGYAPGYTTACGYYDRWGRWIPTGCAAPYGYGY